MIRLDTVITVKYTLIVILTCLLTCGVYGVVRRSAVTRCCFEILGVREGFALMHT